MYHAKQFAKIKNLMDANGHVGEYLDLSGTQITALPDGLTVGGSLDLRGTQITALPDGLTVGEYLYLRGTQWASIAFSDVKKFAAPWFAGTLVIKDIGRATGWCKNGIREAMGAIGLESHDDVEEYDRAEIHTALKKAAKAIGDDEKVFVALAILNRVESGK